MNYYEYVARVQEEVEASGKNPVIATGKQAQEIIEEAFASDDPPEVAAYDVVKDYEWQSGWRYAQKK